MPTYTNHPFLSISLRKPGILENKILVSFYCNLHWSLFKCHLLTLSFSKSLFFCWKIGMVNIICKSSEHPSPSLVFHFVCQFITDQWYWQKIRKKILLTITEGTEILLQMIFVFKVDTYSEPDLWKLKTIKGISKVCQQVFISYWYTRNIWVVPWTNITTNVSICKKW